MTRLEVAWVTDNVYENGFVGGAEITEFLIMEEGRKRNHHISIITPDDEPILDLLQKFDIFILNNVVKFRKDTLEQIYRNFTVPFVNYFHDYNFCKYRNADCEFYKCEGCIPEVKKMFGNILSRAKLNIFLSPMHQEYTQKVMRDSVTNPVIIPSPLDANLFRKSKNGKKDNSHIYVGNLYKGKGIPEMLKKYARLGKNLTIIGNIWNLSDTDKLKLKTHNYLGSLSQQEVANELRKSKSFIRLTPLKESFGRSSIEAIACGCKIISHNKIGFDSFECSNEELITKCKNAPNEFWNKIEEVLEA